MLTNDERREVAARLRDARVKLESVPVPKSIGEQSFTYLLELTKAIGKHDGALFDRFADLIEPEERTCGLRSRFTGMYCYERSECGHGMKQDWRYCPNCGAKVVE
jgi:hypothetical protein